MHQISDRFTSGVTVFLTEEVPPLELRVRSPGGLLPRFLRTKLIGETWHPVVMCVIDAEVLAPLNYAYSAIA